MSNSTLSHRERMEKCLSGEITDQVPVALWRHFPVDDQRPETLAAAITNFQKNYDFDFIKVTPASSYCIKDWGVEDAWSGFYHGTRDYIKRRVHKLEDWQALKPLDPKSGNLGEMLSCLKILVNEFSPDTPVIQTIFSPLSQAKNLVGPNQLLVHLREHPDAVFTGLQTITESTMRFIHEISLLGIDGIFYAVQHAQTGLLSRDEFEQFGRNFDLDILNNLPEFFLNVAHLHGKNIMFDMVRDYPVHVLNWHDQETYPSLQQALTLFEGIVCGGLKQEETMVLGTPQQVQEERQAAIEATKGKRLILGTGLRFTCNGSLRKHTGSQTRRRAQINMSGPRIISGEAKGKQLKSVPGNITRPITGKVKGALFNILGTDVAGSYFLDLFGGTGSVGLEALSRGADFVVLIDKHRTAYATIKENLGLLGFEERADAKHMDALKYLEMPPERDYDYIFIAPTAVQRYLEKDSGTA
jgi:uroporphyrinogen decarboxylase